MSQDYRIIVQVEGGGTSRKTKPSGTKATQDSKPKLSISNIISVVRNPLGSVARNVIPHATAAIFALHMAEKAANFAADMYAADTGDYGFSIDWHNATNTIRNTISPFKAISTAMNVLKEMQRERLYNKEQEYNKDLLGSTKVTKGV